MWVGEKKDGLFDLVIFHPQREPDKDIPRPIGPPAGAMIPAITFERADCFRTLPPSAYIGLAAIFGMGSRPDEALRCVEAD